MKKGIAYFAIVLFVASLACSCGARKAQCGAYSKVDNKVEKKDVSI
jgi:hypothetical protein